MSNVVSNLVSGGALRADRLAPSRLEQEQASFAQVMNTAQRELDTNVGERARQEPTDKTRKAAQDFVALAFVQPILKQLRESNQAAAPFAATSAQKSFQGMLDGVLSRKITQGSNWALVDKVADRMLRKGQSALPELPPDASHTSSQKAAAPSLL